LSASLPKHLDALTILADEFNGTEPASCGEADASTLEATLRQGFQRLSRVRLLERLIALGVPSAAVNSYDEVMADPQVRARGLVQNLPHPAAASNSAQILTSPIRLG